MRYLKTKNQKQNEWRDSKWKKYDIATKVTASLVL